MICVEVYGKRDCCLCEEAKATLLRVRRQIVFDLHEIDIESTPELYEAYKERIPLVLINGCPAFKFRVDEEALRLRLAREQVRAAEGETQGRVLLTRRFCHHERGPGHAAHGPELAHDDTEHVG